MRTILVTGGAGFIGSSLVDNLLQNGEFVISIDNFDPFYDKEIKLSNISKQKENLNYKFCEGNILDEAFLSKIFTDYKIDVVIHLAAKAGVRPSLEDPDSYFQTNINGTITLLNVMNKFNVKKLLFASSSSVYGNNKKVPFSESDNVDFPVSPYAASKKSGELICYTYSHLYDFDIYLFRFFTVFGPRQRPEMAIAKFTDNIAKDIPITLFFGNGETKRDYTYIDDIVTGLVAGVEKVSGYEIFNLGNSRTVKLMELVNLIEENLGKKANIIKKECQPGDVVQTYAEIEKAKNLLNYYPKTPIEDGIAKYVQWYKEQLM
ncbi:MAG: GDP-mannose 4,6-dehydratase [Melioribacteraceae bacterium]|nr:GDP-mannose 4,6-dehydratase [Melioribacteraceae bacterium]